MLFITVLLCKLRHWTGWLRCAWCCRKLSKPGCGQTCQCWYFQWCPIR